MLEEGLLGGGLFWERPNHGRISMEGNTSFKELIFVACRKFLGRGLI